LRPFKSFIVSSHSNDSPTTACKPFHKNRDGIVLGEGAWIVVVESLERAQARQARIYAELVGYGTSCDAFHPSSPHPDGIYCVAAIRQAIGDAGLVASQIDYVSAYGNGTIMNDPLETAIYKKVFGERAYEMAFSSIKSMIGHAVGATGAAQAVASALAIHEKFIPPTVNCDEPDPLCDLDYVADGSRSSEVQNILVNTLSFGGKNSCLVIKRFSPDRP
jgi:3-oxoacyl-[acyl-carrier-protein] synthase II